MEIKNFIAIFYYIDPLGPSLLEKVGKRFLGYNKKIGILNLPQLSEVGDDFLYHNEILQNIDLPKLTKIGNFFMAESDIIQNLNLPNVVGIGSMFLVSNYNLKNIELPYLESEFITNNDLKYLENIISKKIIGEYPNTKLRDEFKNLEDLCEHYNENVDEINENARVIA